MRVRAAIVLLLSASLALGAAPGPRGPAGPLDTDSDLDAALFFEERILDHLHNGQIHEQYYRTAERETGDIAFIVGEMDSALYTGNYLASQGFRFALANERLVRLEALRARRDRGLPPQASGKGPSFPDDLDEQIAFWAGQRTDAKWRVDTIVEQFHVLTRISAAWYGNPDLRLGGKPVPGASTRECDPHWSGRSTADLTEDDCDEELPQELVHDVEQSEWQRNGYVDYGGGVLTGGSTPVNAPQPGLLFRYCTPTDADPRWNAGRNQRSDRLAGPLAWDNDGDGTIEEGEAQWCLGGTSRDAYAGVTFGLATALDLVGPEDPDLQREIAIDLMGMTDYALKYYWTAPRSHGRVVIPEVFDGNTLEGSYQVDMFFQVPLHRLNMLQIAKRAAEVAGTPEQLARYEALWAEEIATQLPVLAASMLVDAADPHSGYYKYHLHHQTAFNLIRIERDPVLRAEFMRAVGVMDNHTRLQPNAFYEAIAYALTGEEDRLADAVQHHREWLDYFANQEATGHFVQNSLRCRTPENPDGDLECVPTDAAPVVVDAGGQELAVDRGAPNQLARDAGLAGPVTMRAAEPLPIADRRSGDFMWQKDPTLLDGGPNNHRYAAPGADFLTPYWILRWYSEVERPAVTPFGAPPTPRFP